MRGGREGNGLYQEMLAATGLRWRIRADSRRTIDLRSGHFCGKEGKGVLSAKANAARFRRQFAHLER